MQERAFRQDVLAGTHNAKDAAAQQEFTVAELLVWRDKQMDWVQGKAAALTAAVRNLPEDDLQTLLALRTGRRRWRLDPDDWHNLARALLALQPRGMRPAAPAEGGTADVLHVQRVVLGALLRGHLVARRPAARQNEFLMRAVAETAAAVPRADVLQLVSKWRALSPDAAHRAVLRALRYGELNPANERNNPDAARRFVRGMLTQVPPPPASVSQPTLGAATACAPALRAGGSPPRPYLWLNVLGTLRRCRSTDGRTC